jgi:hypothetical protein
LLQLFNHKSFMTNRCSSRLLFMLCMYSFVSDVSCSYVSLLNWAHKELCLFITSSVTNWCLLIQLMHAWKKILIPTLIRVNIYICSEFASSYHCNHVPLLLLIKIQIQCLFYLNTYCYNAVHSLFSLLPQSTVCTEPCNF